MCRKVVTLAKLEDVTAVSMKSVVCGGECDTVYFYAYVLISYTGTLKMEADFRYETTMHMYENTQHRVKDDDKLSERKCV